MPAIELAELLLPRNSAVFNCWLGRKPTGNVAMVEPVGLPAVKVTSIFTVTTRPDLSIAWLFIVTLVPGVAEPVTLAFAVSIAVTLAANAAWSV